MSLKCARKMFFSDALWFQQMMEESSERSNSHDRDEISEIPADLTSDKEPMENIPFDSRVRVI